MATQPEQSAPPMPTNIGRTVDFHVASNRNIVIFSLIVMALIGAYRLLTGMSLGDVVINALGAGVFTFLAWAVGRELDPDHDITAYLAAGVMVGMLFAWPLPRLLSVGILLAALRVVNRSTGLAPHQADALMLMIGAGVTVALDGYWVVGALVALAFALDSILPQPAGPRSLMYAGVTLVLTIIASVVAGLDFWQFETTVPVLLALVFISVIYGAWLWRPQPALVAVGDLTGEPLQPRRVLAAQWLVLAAGLSLFVTGGTAGFVTLLPMWAAMIGFVGRRITRQRDG